MHRRRSCLRTAAATSLRCTAVLGRYDLLDVDKDHVAVEYDNFFKTAGEEVQEVTLKVISCSDGIME